MRTNGGLTVERRTSIGISHVDDLGSHGDAPALIDRAGHSVSFRDLDRRVDDVAATLGPGRRLVVAPMPTTVDAVISYLASLRAGHVALICQDDAEEVARLVVAFDPDTVLDQQHREVSQRRDHPAHDLHPDLAVLLSTSGSTGSPRLVRQSHRNLDSNAHAIAEALGLRPTDRAITSLPLHYCYGLSVLHSHLTVGAAVVLHDASVVDTCFWDSVDRHRVTTLAGVPHSFELMDRSPVRLGDHPSLRLVTQAGGRLHPDLVRTTADEAAAHGIDFRVMYGQTEATARIAITPPGMAGDHPTVVGVPVPGSEVRVVGDADSGEIGELVVEGPGVMMGYAVSPADLARGPETTALHTGDLARIRDDGAIEIVGRRADFVKLYGLRIDLRQVSDLLAADGFDVHVAGDDDGLVVAVLDASDPEAVRRDLARRLSLPHGAIACASIDELPRLANGKVDRTAVLREVRRRGAASVPLASLDEEAPDVHAVFSRVLGTGRVGADDSFVSLGGDSLSYVEMSVRLEHVLGHLPDAWHLRSVAELESLARRPTRWARVETNVAIRAIAIVLILANHTGAFLIGGGAHVLLAGAGFNLARFQLYNGPPWRSILRLAVPAVTWIGLVAAVRPDFDLAHALLLHGWVGGPGRWAYWFVEVLAQLLVATAVLLSIPAIRRLERRRPFLFPAALTAAALTVRFDVVDLGDHHRPFFRPHEVAWIFLLGWLAQRADTAGRRVAVTAAVAASVPGYFASPTRELVLAGGLVALVWVSHVAIPRRATTAVGALAGASLWIYLTHFQVHPLLSADQPAAAMALSVAVGIAAWRVVDPPLMRLSDRLVNASRRRAGPDTEQAAGNRDTVAA